MQENKIFQDEYKILQQVEKAEGPTDISLLDVRLLCVLVRNFGSIPGPKNGWNRRGLRADDKSKGADVLRIGNIRNECHHLPSSNRITKEKFDEIYPKLKEVLSRLVGGTPNERDFQSLVSEFDDQDFAKRQCNTRTILEKVAQRWRLNTGCETSEENTDIDDSEDGDNGDDSVTFLKCCFANDVGSVKMKLDSLTKETIQEGIAIACRKGYYEMFRILIDQYGLLNHNDLRNACQGGSLEIVSAILEKLNQTTLEDHITENVGFRRCCIHHAANLGFSSIVNCLIQKIPRILMAVDKANNTAMHFASMRGHTDVMETILQTKIGRTQVNALNGKCQIPLHFAAYFGQLSAVKFLIDNGAEINCKDRDGNSVADWCTKGKEQSLQFSWYDPELQIWPVSYGSPEDYENINKILQG